jgi:7-carboxy-7-deazaguanine synthase
MRYPLSPNPIFWTIQGEGHLRGQQMCFVRLAGCSVGCSQCDTDYRVDSRAEVAEIVARVEQTSRKTRDRWVCITGGEPSDHDLCPLIDALHTAWFSVMLITSGKRRIIPPVDWLSVSPHELQFAQKVGHEIKLVDGLNGLDLEQWHAANPDDGLDFMNRYVQPLWKDGREDPESMARCLAFLERHPEWQLSRQDHKTWGVA